jgi:hypothetical protein
VPNLKGVSQRLPARTEENHDSRPPGLHYRIQSKGGNHCSMTFSAIYPDDAVHIVAHLFYITVF